VVWSCCSLLYLSSYGTQFGVTRRPVMSWRGLHLVRRRKTKAGWITAATLFLGGCVAIGVTLSRGGNHGPDGSTISRTGNHGPDGPIINSTSETSTAPEPLWANITAARPCQPNFEGSALAVNGSHVEWGFWGISEGAQAVIVQVFNRSVSEFLVFFRGEPINMYHIQTPNNSRVVTDNNLILTLSETQDLTPSWNVSCEACRLSGFGVPGLVARGCIVSVASSTGNERTCVELPDTPGKSLMLTPCTENSSHIFDFTAL